ncbi:MAG: DNA replication/repair protein RecF [Armatimonadetes bacterium]|nr:DNA replication/repair protein RecF [Armatimonadota bacterium]
MRVRHLKLSHFRNYVSLDLTPGDGVNILYGQNAQGKTNVLEALSLLATTRSLRASRESELICRGGEMAHVMADIVRECQGDVDLEISVFQTDKKEVKINGSRRGRVVDVLGQFNAVFFGSIDLVIVTGEPADRRHYLNVEISQISPRYIYDLGHYKRVLAQRNRLLKELRDRPRPPKELGLDVWNEQLINYGAPIIEKRQFYLARLAPLANQVHRELTDGKESLEIRYLPSIRLPKPAQLSTVSTDLVDNSMIREVNREMQYLHEIHEGIPASESTSQTRTESPLSDTEAIAMAFREQMSEMGLEEARRGTTLLGPQRDDIGFFIDGAETRLYGSQGQQRTATLALKLAEFQLIQDYVGEPPIMLLDDVMSDLDDNRRAHLLEWIRRRCQTFITCTSLRPFPKEILAEATTFQIANGVVTPDVRKKSRNSRILTEKAVSKPETAPESVESIP